MSSKKNVAEILCVRLKNMLGRCKKICFSVNDVGSLHVLQSLHVFTTSCVCDHSSVDAKLFSKEEIKMFEKVNDAWN
jgi:hypothetical protein